MAGTISYAYNLNQKVWVISTSSAGLMSVQEGTVLRIRGTVFGSPVVVEYDIQLIGDLGTTPFSQTDVFADVPSAMAAYQSRLVII